MNKNYDSIEWSGGNYLKLRGLVEWAKGLIAQGRLGRFVETCRRHDICPIEFVSEVVDSGVYAVDCYAEGMKLLKRVNARGKLNDHFTEVTSKTLQMTDGHHPYGLIKAPEQKGKYTGNEPFLKKSISFEVKVSYVLSLVREYYLSNPPLVKEVDTDILDGLGEDQVTIPSKESTFVFPAQPLEAKIELVKQHFRTDGDAWSNAPKEVITSLFTRQEIGETLAGKYFGDMQS